ncbi:MarR family winged helix-turn-helix transcriptional regulator [Agrococcus terreus]|uniref:MarR family transcriptional regulator n=1 Tax=Agrococcus terreus TaxID=574649 RepID=A0ABQ2KMH3_9MICO|nr:MarR family winged helix-turn-helix transcriptional regulator [Agrococcus terreus]GGN85747.1 MarR family transcriptional regulator [Agrococcus terreus]
MPTADPAVRVTDQMVCFALYSASRATSQAYRALLEPWGLTYPQYLVLATLWVEGPRTVRDLGEGMQLDSGTLSPLLARMEAAGLVRRERGGADARVVTVHPTDRALELRGELRHIPAAIAAAMGLGSAADVEALLASLHGVAASLHAVADTAPTGSGTTDPASAPTA